MTLTVFDTFAFIYMISIWCSFAQYAKYRAKHCRKTSLSRTLRQHRIVWIQRMLTRDVRITDANLLASQERVVAFFASTTVLLLAAVITALTKATTISEITAEIPFISPQDAQTIQIKLFLLSLVLVYAFFAITWSLRQYGFVSVLIGSAPNFDEDITPETRDNVIKHIAKLMDSAGHDNNNGLRAYYYGFAMLFWLFDTTFMVAVTTLVTAVLYQRECKSKAINSMDSALHHPD